MNITRTRLIIVVTIVWSTAVGFSIKVQGQDASAKITVWDKVYTEGQAKRGETAYMTACSSCHAEDLTGSDLTPPLKGADFAFRWNGKSVGDFFARMSAVMPEDDPGGLPRQTYLDLTAFMLKANNYPAGDKELGGDLETLKQIAFTAKP
jgi:cytochrome c